MSTQENLVNTTAEEQQAKKNSTKAKKAEQLSIDIEGSNTEDKPKVKAPKRNSEKERAIAPKSRIKKRVTLKAQSAEPEQEKEANLVDEQNNSSKNESLSNNESSENQNQNENEQEEELVFTLKNIKAQKFDELLKLAESLDIDNCNSMNKQDLVFNVLKCLALKGAIIQGEGVLEILSEGYGFLRSASDNYYPGSYDIYISPNQIKRLDLRSGDTVIGPIRAPKKGERYFALIRVQEVNSSECKKNRPHFDDLTPLYPEDKFMMESVTHKKDDLSARIIDIMTPIGKGQRALIVAPPRSGKTTLMRSIAHSIAQNHPEVYLMVLLVDERPEEVTDMKRFVKGEVVSSTFDETSARHVQLAEIVIEKAKRLVEEKRDVVILLDNITRLARAYNNTAPSSGKVLSGGVDSNALQRPKRFFGAARNIEEGGSLTIIATALIETGSRMDEVIFEEFKGTGNSEIVLDRKISDRRIYPAIDILRSGTRKEDLLLPKNILSKTWILRKIINSMSNVEAAEFLIDKLKVTRSNKDFFEQMQSVKVGA